MLYCLVAGVTAWMMYHTYHLQKRVGLITGVSLLIFFGTRFALEFMKNPQVAEEADMTFNIGQWLSVPLILLGAYLIATSVPGKNKGSGRGERDERTPFQLSGIALYITCGARPSLSIFFSLLHWRSSLPAFVFSNPVKAQYSLQVIMECSFR